MPINQKVSLKNNKYLKISHKNSRLGCKGNINFMHGTAKNNNGLGLNYVIITLRDIRILT